MPDTQEQNNQETKVTFTAEQQARIDEIVREAMSRAGKDAREQLEQSRSKISDLEAQLSTIGQQMSERKSKSGEEDPRLAEFKSVSDQLKAEQARLHDALKAKETQNKTLQEQMEDVRKQVVIQQAIGKVAFVDPESVSELTARFIKWSPERNRFTVVTNTGVERLNSSYEPMSLDEFYAEYAVQKPFLVRGDVRPGAGSSEAQGKLSSNGKYTVEQIFGKNSDSQLANRLALEDKKEYHRLKQVAKENKLI